MSKAIIDIFPDRIGVKFSSPNFSRILEIWKNYFPQAVYDQSIKCWYLPLANLENVKKFCHQYFWEVKIQPNLLNSTQQMKLKI